MYHSETQSRWYGIGRVLILLSYTSDKLFYQANKQNEITKWLNMEAKLCIQQIHFRTLLPRKNISNPNNINGNISYESIFKHRKYWCDSLVSFLFIYRESWRRHCPWIAFIQKYFMWSWSSWGQCFPFSTRFVNSTSILTAILVTSFDSWWHN